MTRLQNRVAKLREITGGSHNTGNMADEVCWLLFGLIRHHRPGVVIQTGHLWGKSALVVLEALTSESLDSGQGDGKFGEFVREHSPVTANGVLHSVDPGPAGVPRPNQGIDQLKEWYPGRFHFHEESSASFFASCDLAHVPRIFGIVDGDHTPQGARTDLEALAGLGAGTIFLDDTSWLPHLAGVGRDLPGYRVTEFPEYNGIMLLQRIG